MPTADRLAVNAQSPSHFPLMEASVKKSGGFKPSPFELCKVTFDAFWITHALNYHKPLNVSLYYTNVNKWEVIRLPDCKSGVVKQSWKRRLERYQHFPPFRTRSSISRAPRCLREG